MKNQNTLANSLDLSTNKFVSACAGAGKTFALSKRYCKILDEFTRQNSDKTKPDWLGVKNILVITFTNKAAAEMSGRIYEDLEILLHGNEIESLKEQEIELGENIRKSSDEYKRWVRSTFSHNYISTIDGFCGKILRENAHQIGIDPKFKTFEDVQTGQVFDDTLTEFIEQKSEEFDKNLKILLDNISVYKIRQFIKYLFDNRAFVQEWLEFIKNDENYIKENWIASYTPDCEVEQLTQILQNIKNYAHYYSAPEDNKGISIFKALDQSLTKLTASVSKKEKQRIVLAEILPLFQTGKGTYFKKISSWKKTNWENESIYREFKDIVIDFCDHLREELPENEILKAPNDNDFKAIPVLKSLVELYTEFSQKMWQKQLELNFLNFNDIILKTKELLLDFPKIRKKYFRQFRHIMVDEFQDTNDVRWEIIKLLGMSSREEHEVARRNEKLDHKHPSKARHGSEDFKHSEVLCTFGSLRESGIFIVGDKKQSIYRFNQADVEVMNRAEMELTHPQLLTFKRGELKELENKNVPLFFKEGFGELENIVISFNDNYRSTKDFIEFVINPLFSNIMPKTEKTYEAEFEPTTYKQIKQSVNKIAEKTRKVCTIQSVYAEKETSNEDMKHLSALNAAIIVKEYLKWSEELNLNEKVVTGVLLRKFTNIQNYLKVFQAQNIPFEILGGRGLFQQQEIFDLFHFVSVLYNPFDDLALVGLLRSPFFAISDKEIHHLKNRKKEQPVFSFMKECVEFEETVRIIQNWRKNAQTKSIDVLLQNILLSEASNGEILSGKIRKVEDHDSITRTELSEFSDDENMEEKLRKGDISTRRFAYESNKIRFGYFSEIGGAQRIVNLEKILNTLSELSLEGSSLKNIYNFLKYQIENNKETAQAETPSSAKVQILSIHRAKGLEFPTVIIPEMNTQTKSDSASISHGRIIKNGRIEVGISLDDEGESKKMHLLAAIKNKAKAEIDAENKRLFYVAVTRAKYRIAFLSEFKNKQTKSRNFWNNYIRPCYEIPHDLDPEKWKDMKFEKTEIDLLSVDELKQKLELDTVSEPLIWKEPPVRNFGKRFLKVNPHDLMKRISRSPSESKKEKESAEYAKNFGTIVHKIMEKEWWDIEECKLNIKKYMKGNFPEISFDSITDELNKHISNFKKSELFPIISQIPEQDKFPELPVIGWMDNSKEYLQVSGIIDLLYKYEDKWFILDYKTDKDKSSLDEYKIQIQTYIRIVKQLYNFDATGQIFFTKLGEIVNLNPSVFAGLKPQFSYEEGEKLRKMRSMPASSCEETEKQRNWEKNSLNFEESENLKIIIKILENEETANKPALFSADRSESDLHFSSQEKGPRDEVLIINPTEQQCFSQIRYLSEKKLLTPKIQILTLHKLLTKSEIPGKKISYNFVKLLVRRLVSGKKYTDGMIELLTDAILKNEKFGTGLKPEFREIANKFQQLKKVKNYYTDADEIKKFDLDLNNKMIVLNGFVKESPLEFELMHRISKSAGKFYFLDNFDEHKLKTKFLHSPQIWENAGKFPSQKYEQTCELCFSVQEEVERVSKLILSIPNWQQKLASVKIAVSSLERYVPTISAIFSDYGIPFRSSKNKLLLKIPVIQLLLNFIELFMTRRIKWETIFDVFLHPLLEPVDELFLLEKFCRKNGIVYFDERTLLSESSQEENMNEKLRKGFFNLNAVLSNFLDEDKSRAKTRNEIINEKVSEFIDDRNLEEKIKNDKISIAALEKFQSDLKMFVRNYRDVGINSEIQDFFNDFKKHLVSIEIPIKEQKYGIEVIGLLDSFEIPVQHLFILGLTAGDFPISIAPNPFLNSIPNNKWSYSLLLLNHWNKLGDKVRYFAPERDIDGSVLQPSTFLEILNVVKSYAIPEPGNIPESRTEHFKKYYQGMIENPGNNRYLQRHNEFLQNEISSYKGKTEKQDSNDLIVSATTMDNLLKCPQKFWFSNKLNLKDIEFNEDWMKKQQRGDIIHKTLENFGKSSGFKIVQKKFAEACDILAEKLETELHRNKIDPAKNLLLNNFFKIYREGLSSGNENNILVRLLKWNMEFLSDFQQAKFEQAFGMNKEYFPDSWATLSFEDKNVILKFRGIIDKILIDKENMVITATDYKTGKVEYKDIYDKFSSQFIIYLFALKEHFAGFDLTVAYEKIRSLKSKEYGISDLIQNESDSDILEISNKKTTIDLNEMILHFLKLVSQVIKGHFPLAEKDKQEKACKYCEFEQICRKNCFHS